MSEIKAGTGLDEQVARALGWRLVRGEEIPEGITSRGAIEPHLAGIWVDSEGQRQACIECGDLPAFSTEIGDAWTVFIAAVERFGTVLIEGDMEEWGQEHPVTVTVGNYAARWLPFPEAMCKGFLAAVKFGKHDAASQAGKVQRCHANIDGECVWQLCPQLRDGEPDKTGRHCPLDTRGEDDEW